MSVFSRIFTKAEDSAEPEVEKTGEEEFRRRFASFITTKKGAEKFRQALDAWATTLIL